MQETTNFHGLLLSQPDFKIVPPFGVGNKDVARQQAFSLSACQSKARKLAPCDFESVSPSAGGEEVFQQFPQENMAGVVVSAPRATVNRQWLLPRKIP